MEIAGKVALVTGTRRLGAVVAQALAERGADIAIGYRRSRAEAEQTKAVVEGLGRRAFILAADLRQPAECERLVTSAVAALGRLDVLVHMASIYEQKAFDALAPADLADSLAVEVAAAFACARAAVPHMRAAGGGRIVTFSDWLPASGRPRYPGFLAYYVAKAAIIGLTEALALELAPDGILVNAVAPGPIQAPPDLGEAELRAVEEATPLKRWGGPAEAARAVVGFVETDFVTGETLRVDGGRHLR